jgi:hypothetical protein
LLHTLQISNMQATAAGAQISYTVAVPSAVVQCLNPTPKAWEEPAQLALTVELPCKAPVTSTDGGTQPVVIRANVITAITPTTREAAAAQAVTLVGTVEPNDVIRWATQCLHECVYQTPSGCPKDSRYAAAGLARLPAPPWEPYSTLHSECSAEQRARHRSDTPLTSGLLCCDTECVINGCSSMKETPGMNAYCGVTDAVAQWYSKAPTEAQIDPADGTVSWRFAVGWCFGLVRSVLNSPKL